VPFAYIAIAGIATALSRELWPWLLVVFGLIGIAVGCHMNGLKDGIERAVGHINKVEEALGLTPTASTAKWISVDPFLYLVWSLVIGSLLVGAVVLDYIALCPGS
jgi:hypothetical protein